MRLLILGGTQFIGRHIVEAFLIAGHTVSILTRGRTADELPDSVERIRGDRDEGYSGIEALRNRNWDACVDVSGYTPKQVRSSAELLKSNVERAIFISAVSAYGDPSIRPVLETHPLMSPASEEVMEINGETYGPLKVACEQIVGEIFGDRSAILRPQIVVGPYDLSGRYSYWLNRAKAGGEMLAPGDGSDHVQFIDARDLAKFTVRVVEDRLSGAYNLAGERLEWREFLQILGAKKLAWVSSEILQNANLTFQELPLFRPEHGERSSLMHVSNQKALLAGLSLTHPALTALDTRNWSGMRDLPQALSSQREAELIRISKLS